jgi:hypothetical protein
MDLLQTMSISSKSLVQWDGIPLKIENITSFILYAMHSQHFLIDEHYSSFNFRQ